MSKSLFKSFISAVLLLSITSACHSGDAVKATEEVSHDEGWVSLFDGKTFTGWSGANGGEIGQQWQAIDGEMVLTEGGGGDIVTQEKFTNFELSLEWKISPKGNSGIFYRVLNDGDIVYMSGVEYQVLDNDAYPDLSSDSHKSGGVFDMYAPINGEPKPVGEFNSARIVVDKGHVEHWLNGVKVVEYEWQSEDWDKHLNASKFKDWKNFGKAETGHIALQDHGDQVTYRNIKIRKLP